MAQGEELATLRIGTDEIKSMWLTTGNPHSINRMFTYSMPIMVTIMGALVGSPNA